MSLQVASRGPARPFCAARVGASAPRPALLSARRPLQLSQGPSARTHASSGDGPKEPATTDVAPTDSLSDDELSRISNLRRQQPNASGASPAPVVPQPSSNPFVAAAEEAQLITWPTPQKALVDTVLVLSIVVASGLMLFGMNVGMSALSEWYYHRG